MRVLACMCVHAKQYWTLFWFFAFRSCVLQFGKIAHKRGQHCYLYLLSFLPLCVVCSGRVSMTQTGSLNLFSSKEQEFELRAQMLKRLSFAIFCSPPDQYQRNMPEIQGQWGLPHGLKCCMFTVCLDCGVFSVCACVCFALSQ